MSLASQLAADVERVRDAIGRDVEDWREAFRAFERVVARITDLEAQVERADENNGRCAEALEAAEAQAAALTQNWKERALAAEARVESLTQEHDEAEGLYAATANHLRASQAALASTRQALTALVGWADGQNGDDFGTAEWANARRALEDTR